MYDGCLEKSCVNMSIPCVSQSEKQSHYVTALKLTKGHLLNLWKGNQGAMADKLPRYMAEPSEEVLPSVPQEPSLNLCSLIDGVLCLPRNIRAEFLTDPVLVRPSGAACSKSLTELLELKQNKHSRQQLLTPKPLWMHRLLTGRLLSVSEPREKDQWHRDFDGKINGKFQWCPELTAYIIDAGDTQDAEAPKAYRLYVEANEAYKISVDEAFLTFGAGVWLLDSKAESFLAENAKWSQRCPLCIQEG